jgi:pimeloyl-ACP methyl ester carboxylesterase
VEGTALYYETSGSGTPVVFLHGNPADCRSWDFQWEEFARHYQVIRYDLRGFGRSKPAAVSYSHAADLLSLLDHLKAERVYLVGWSMGGGAVVNFTLSHPGRVKGIVLVNSSLGGFPYSETFTSTYFVNLINLARKQGVEPARKQLLQHPIFASVHHHPEAFNRLSKCIDNYSGWHWLNKDPGMPFSPPAIERLGEIKVPALVFIGEHDVPDMKAIADILATKIQGAKKVSMPDVGHCPPLEKPDEFNKIVLDFIAGNEA